MRVVDGLSVYDMAKKKPKNVQASKDASPDDVDASSRCTHITKAISLSAIQKALKQRPFVEHCLDCFKDGPNPGADDGLGIDMSAWLCLQCAYQGCGRSSPLQHAMKHYQTPRSTSHCLVVNMQNWCCWCYDCDSELSAEKYPQLLRAIECVQKTNSAAFAGPGRKDQSILDMKDSISARKASDGHVVDSPVPGGVRVNGFAPNAGLMLPKLKGLNNLGNTCFMNAILQNLCQTHLLEHVLHDLAKKDATFFLPGFKSDQARLWQPDLDHASDDGSSSSRERTQSLTYLEPLTVPVIGFGDLTSALRNFIIDMNAAAKGNIISPANLFSQVCKKAPRFKGLQQQDSHELLRYLLDGMRNEEIFCRKHGILKLFKIRDSAGKDIDDEKKIRLKAYGVQLKLTSVDSIFGGHLLSSVVCQDCGHASQVFESFLDLSLSIAENKGVEAGSGRYNHGEPAGRSKRIIRSSKDEDADNGTSSSVVQLSKHQLKMQKQQSKKEVRLIACERVA